MIYGAGHTHEKVLTGGKESARFWRFGRCTQKTKDMVLGLISGGMPRTITTASKAK
jgi:hypothetical protein